jgi:acetyl-CoA carboxylase biotin carboxyl carrier protein
MADNARPSWNELVQLIAEFDGSDFDNVAVQYDDISIRMSRGDLPAEPVAAAASPVPGPRVVAAPPAALDPTPNASVAPAAPQPASAAPEAGGTLAPAAPQGTAVTSPMVGIFYRSPSPGAPPFVSEGDTVTADSTVGIIEVMKLMNPVNAGIAGTVSTFAVPDAQAVEFGQDLLYIIPEGS